MKQRKLSDLAGIGPAMLKDFELLEIQSVEELSKANPQKLYEQLCQITHIKHDICVLDVFSCAIAQARDPNLPQVKCQWFWWSRERKKKASR